MKTCEKCGDSYEVGVQNYCSVECAIKSGHIHEYENFDDGNIQDSDLKPAPCFMGSDDYHLGMELETEGNTSAAASVRSISKRLFYCKYDGSLSNGFEMVSHPCTLSYWKLQEPMLANLTKFLKRKGVRSYDTDTCGIHIHVSKEAIGGNFHYYKILTLLNREFVLHMTKRKPRNLEQWAKPLSDSQNKAASESDLMYQRYMTVNRGHATFEFRIFRGTLHLPSIYKNLEFVHSVIEFTRNASMEECTPENYYLFINDKEKYNHVRNYCQQQEERAAERRVAEPSLVS